MGLAQATSHASVASCKAPWKMFFLSMRSAVITSNVKSMKEFCLLVFLFFFCRSSPAVIFPAGFLSCVSGQSCFPAAVLAWQHCAMHGHGSASAGSHAAFSQARQEEAWL